MDVKSEEYWQPYREGRVFPTMEQKIARFKELMEWFKAHGR